MKRLLVFASAIALIAGCSSQNTTYRGTTGEMGAGTDAGYGIGVAPNQQGAGAVQLTSSGLSASDVQFLQRAAQYNQTSIQLGQTIVQKSDTPALKTFGQRMVDDHTLAGQQLQSIVATTGATVPSAPNTDQQQMLDRLNGLNGSDFDQAATQDSIRLSERQVNLYSQNASSANSPEVRQYAQRNLSMAQDELNQARSLNAPAPTVTQPVPPPQPQQ